MKLFAHECCECGIVMSYSLAPEILPDSMCNNCTDSFATVSSAMGVPVQDETGADITEKTIIERKIIPDAWSWDWRVRTHIGQWRLEYQTNKALAKRN